MKTKTAIVRHYTAWGTIHRFSAIDYRGSTIQHFDHENQSIIFDWLKAQGFTHAKIESSHEAIGIVTKYKTKI